MASGIFIVPILILFAGVDLHTAIGASIISVIACSCSSAAPFLKSHLTNIRLAIVLESASTLGALVGVLLINAIPVRALYLLFSLVLIVSAKQMFSRRQGIHETLLAGEEEGAACRWSDALQLRSSYYDPALGRFMPYGVQRLPMGLSLMFGAGVISALLGIGSGVLKIPAMDTALRLPIKVASATSNFMIGATAAASAGAYFLRGDIIASVAGPVALGSVAGSLAGAHILMRLSSEKLRLLFCFILLALSLQMGFLAFGITPLGK